MHYSILVILGGVSLWLSVVFILRLFLLHKKTPLWRKLFWSVILLAPFVGPMLYGSLFRPLGPHSIGEECGASHGDAPYSTGGSIDNGGADSGGWHV